MFGKFKKVIVTTAMIVVVVTTIFMPLFVVTWYDHTLSVQAWVQESFVEFRKNDIDWTEFDPDDRPEELLADLRDAIVRNIVILRNDAFREENTAYMETLYILIAALVNDPDNRPAIIQGIFSAQAAQARLYEAIERFQNNTFYAMRHTI